MTCGNVEIADWRVEQGTLGPWLADWLKRGYTPADGQPEPILIDGVAYHRYRMVHVGL